MATASPSTAGIPWLSACELGVSLRAREISAVEVVDALLERIAEINPRYTAFVDVFEQDARREALASERRFAAGRPLGPLDGIPFAVKDLESLEGRRLTMGIPALEHEVATSTAPAVSRLIAAGANVLGKTNTPEFGHKGMTDNKLFGPTSTPFGEGMNSGGSSGGAAAAVATGLVPLAQGGDGGGSIRIPAAMCGVFGYKPSAGAVPLLSRPNGFVGPPYVSLGPITRTVEDAILMAEAMIGPHRGDPVSLPDGAISLRPVESIAIEDLRIAYSPALDVFAVGEDVRGVVEEAIDTLRAAGATVEPIELGLSRSQHEISQVWLDDIAVANAEQCSLYAERGIDLLGTHRASIPVLLLEMIEAGYEMSALRYRRNGGVRTEVFDAVQSVFEDWDVLLSPTLAIAGVPNREDGETVGPSEIDGAAINPHTGWCLTYPFNLTGHPAASVPAGLTAEGLPVGLQVIGPRWRDDLVLTVSAAMERCNPWLDQLCAVVDGRG